jgi:type I restriction enzyme S subunit
MSFPRYPRYKDSGVGWLGEVPEHWAVGKLKHAIGKLEQGWSPPCENRPAADDEWGVLKVGCGNDEHFDPMEQKALPLDVTPEARFEIRAGDILMSRGNTQDLVGSATLVPNVVRPRLLLCDLLYRFRSIPSIFDASFLVRSLRSKYTRLQLEREATGTSASMKKVGQDVVRGIVLPQPPLAEQTAIATFLDRETSKIDALVAEQRRLVELLKEKRQAVISHAVTKGLDPSVPMKASGVAWLGEVPAHWDVKPLMRLTPDDRQIMYGIVLPGPHVDDGVPIVKGGDVSERRLNPDTLNRTTHEIEANYVRSRLAGGDIVYAIRGTIGEVAIVPSSLAGANLTQDAARIAPRPGTDVQWLLFTLKSNGVFAQLEQTVNGATIRGINIFQLKRAKVPVPPADEQHSIALFVAKETSKLDTLITEATQAIALLLERRTALISAAVTGEICAHLAAHGWLYARRRRPLRPPPRAVPRRRVAWVQATQPKAWETLTKNHGANAAETLLDPLREQLDQRGTLDVLRHGIELLGAQRPEARAVQARARDQPRHPRPLRRQPAAGGAAGALLAAQREQHRPGAVPQRRAGGDGGAEDRLHAERRRRRRPVPLRPPPQPKGRPPSRCCRSPRARSCTSR